MIMLNKKLSLSLSGVLLNCEVMDWKTINQCEIVNTCVVKI